jgi:hypothetical protein
LPKPVFFLFGLNSQETLADCGGRSMVTAMSDKMTETVLVNVRVSTKTRPLYCYDKALENLAWQVKQVRIFKRHVPVLKIHPDDADYVVTTAAEVEHQATTLQAIASIPELTSALMDLLDCLTSNNPADHARLEQLVAAHKVYSALSHLSNPQLARIHVILACWEFEEEIGDDEYWDDGIPSALAIKERARELFEETNTLAGLKRNILKRHWDLLFGNMGTKVKFPRGGWERNA